MPAGSTAAVGAAAFASVPAFAQAGDSAAVAEAVSNLTKAMLASAAAWSPDPRNPPSYFDLPAKDGQVLPDIIARWAANAPLAMVHQYIPSLRTYDAIAVDAGAQDLGDIAATVRTLDQILKDYDIAHDFEIYEGDHVNRVGQRLETRVLPFFSRHLKFQ